MPTDYAGLVAMLPPRRVRTAAESKRLTDVIAAMAGFDLTEDQADYVALLATLNDQWRRSRPDYKRATPAELVRLLMGEHGMPQAEMAEIMGIPASGLSMIFAGDRDISKASAKRLAERFKLDVAALL